MSYATDQKIRIGYLLLINLLLVTNICLEAAPTYGELKYGFDRTQWLIICQGTPHLAGTSVSAEQMAALALEFGTQIPSVESVNQTCADLQARDLLD